MRRFYILLICAVSALYCGEDAFNVSGGIEAVYAARLDDIVVGIVVMLASLAIRNCV